jgi:hypothetical protein
MDRTNWKFGETNLNILTVGIVHKGIAYPIAWKLLDKRGNSNTDERIEIMENVMTIIPSHSIQHLLADREFVGNEWFGWLEHQYISFVIRVRNNFIVEIDGVEQRVDSLFEQYTEFNAHSFGYAMKICGRELFVTGAKVDGDYCIVVSDVFYEKALNLYMKRWEIETLFGCLKSRGFNLEDTHMTDLTKISKLFGLLAIAFAWCHIVGEHENTKKPIKIKSHGRKSISIFRLGLDTLQRIFLNHNLHRHNLIPLAKLLSCT